MEEQEPPKMPELMQSLTGLDFMLVPFPAGLIVKYFDPTPSPAHIYIYILSHTSVATLGSNSISGSIQGHVAVSKVLHGDGVRIH